MGVGTPTCRRTGSEGRVDLSTCAAAGARHREEWSRVRDGILSVTRKLKEGDGTGAEISGEDMRMLRYVADAPGDECTSLFNEARRR